LVSFTCNIAVNYSTHSIVSVLLFLPFLTELYLLLFDLNIISGYYPPPLKTVFSFKNINPVESILTV